MSYQRLYPQRINWEDEPSLATPINQVNLNKMDSALFGIDGRVVELDENKVGKSDTFNTARNGVVPKPTQADITNEKVLRADGVWVEQSGGGGGGGGHTIVNNAGTSLQQRGKLKTVGGLNATDDSENNTTKITDEYEIIPWTTWQGYSDAQKAEHPNAIVTGAPDCDGTLEIENMHLAWQNPNPTSSFAGQQITLDTDDYDEIEIWYNSTSGNVIKGGCRKTDSVTSTTMALTTPNSYTSTLVRNCTRNSDTKWTFSDAYSQNANGARSADNSKMIPLCIYTKKNDLTAKIKAIAHDVSTDASKCMMSDEQTSVEDAIGNINGWTLAGNVTSTSLVTVTVPATAKEILAVLLNPSNVVLISQVIPRELMSSGASLKDVANTSKELYSNGSKWKVTDATYTGKIYYRN